MYFRVAGIPKDDNTREMIIKAENPQQAKKQIEAAKAFLFPGEDTEQYRGYISQFPVKVNLGTTIMHYRITVYRPKDAETVEEQPNDETEIMEDCGWETILKADTKEKAIEQAKADCLKDNDDPEKYDIYADEMTIEECIEEEERRLHNLIENTYFHNHRFDELSVREYNKKCREFDTNNNQENYYLALKEFLRTVYHARALIRSKDYENVTLGRFQKAVEKKSTASSQEEYKAILEELKQNAKEV